MELPSNFAGTVRTFLNRDHARILGLHDLLTDEVSAHRASAADDLWRQLEAAVLDHMQVEEHHLLVPFAEVYPEEATALHAEHGRLRGVLRQLRAELSVVALQEFITTFTAHTRHEEHLFYAWAEQGVDVTTKVTIVRELSVRDKAAWRTP